MMYYRNMFLPNPDYRLHWAASPMLAPEEYWPQRKLAIRSSLWYW